MFTFFDDMKSKDGFSLMRKILVKVLRQDKDYSIYVILKLNLLTSNGRIQHWINCCGEIDAMGLQRGVRQQWSHSALDQLLR